MKIYWCSNTWNFEIYVFSLPLLTQDIPSMARLRTQNDFPKAAGRGQIRVFILILTRSSQQQWKIAVNFNLRDTFKLLQSNFLVAQVNDYDYPYSLQLNAIAVRLCCSNPNTNIFIFNSQTFSSSPFICASIICAWKSLNKGKLKSNFKELLVTNINKEFILIYNGVY